MKLLLKNAQIVNVFTDRLETANVLIDDEKIIGVGEYNDTDADTVRDLSGKIICPGFIDGHIHVESTILTPPELARVCLPCGTTAIVADPHEIANVCGFSGIVYMLEASENLPLSVYIMLPSCVPSTPFDETGAVMEAEELRVLYSHPRVLGLGEMMNYPGVLADDPKVMQKISEAHELGKLVNGHAPLLGGRGLDKYIAAGISDDHECSTIDEAVERISKGQHVMIRQGTAAKNLEALLPLFDEPWSRRCILVTDDRHPADFYIEPEGSRCRVIKITPGQLLTDESIAEIDFNRANGIDIKRDILKLAVIERHLNTGHKGIGFISGIGMKKGAIASSVSHDAHNLIVIGTNDEDMASAANRIRAMGGGNVVVSEGKIIAEMPLPEAGLMSDLSAAEIAAQNEEVRMAVHKLGASAEIEPFMNMAFLSLPVIPSLKITTLGLVDVNRQRLVPLFEK